MLYEELLNTEVRERLGGANSADLLVRSYNFADIEKLQKQGDWDAASALLANDAKMLENAGAEVIALCTNTMHCVAEVVEAATAARFVHICDAVADQIKAEGLDTVGLIGTRFTMEEPFYRERLENAGIKVLVPSEDERKLIHRAIYDELVRGTLSRATQEDFLDVIDRLGVAGAQGVIAGCTEIELLVSADDVFVPYFPSTEIHARAIAEAACA